MDNKNKLMTKPQFRELTWNVDRSGNLSGRLKFFRIPDVDENERLFLQTVTNFSKLHFDLK